MGQITISVNDQKYTLACKDGEEERLTALGEYVDSKVADLTESLGQVGEARILLMVSLLIADELHETMDRLAEAKTAEVEDDGVVVEATNGNGANVYALEERMAALLSEASDTMEGIVSELESA